VVAEDEEVRVRQLVVDRKDIGIAVPMPVDDVAERGDELEVLLVERLERRIELPEAVGVVARPARLVREGRILRVGDDAELEEWRVLRDGPRGKPGKRRGERGGAGDLKEGAASDHGGLHVEARKRD
jgi:hypothetical protein